MRRILRWLTEEPRRSNLSWELGVPRWQRILVLLLGVVIILGAWPLLIFLGNLACNIHMGNC